MRVYIRPDWSMDNHRLFLITDGPDRTTYRVANGFTWGEHGQGEMFDTSDGIGQADGLIQAIMNAGWEAGFRPAGIQDAKNETTAIKAHLDDMRAIAFHKLGMK